MTNCSLVKTEKSYLLQEKNTFTIVFWDKNFKINKIELTKMLAKLGLQPLAVNSTKSYQKTKYKNYRKSTKLQFRPKKWMIKLPEGQSIDDEFVEKINQKLIKLNT